MQLKNSFICKEKAALTAPNIFFQSLGLGLFPVSLAKLGVVKSCQHGR